MKKLIPVLILFFSICLHIHWNTKPTAYAAHESIRSWLLDELKKTKEQLSVSLLNLNNAGLLQHTYHESRKHYKQIEFFIEYCSPREAKNFINGPLVPKSDFELSNEVIPPQGFQRIEELLFSDDSIDTKALEQEYVLLCSKLSAIGDYYNTMELSDAQLLEMCQVELFRVAAMNLSGYDATISQTNVMESFWCLEGIEHLIRKFKPYTNDDQALKVSLQSLLFELSKAKKFLKRNPDYNTFNRLEFITTYITPLNKSLIVFHQRANLPWSGRIQALNLQQGFLFGKESLNPQYFSMYYDDTLRMQQQAHLGKLLFFDPILSGNDQRSCASCHAPGQAFTDGYTKGLDFEKINSLTRNTPTLLNVAYQKAFFYDGRAYQLEQQIFDVIHNETEMRSTLEESVTKLQKSILYKQLFRESFKGTADSSITSYAIQKAITEYEKTLVSLNSRFDQYLHGDKTKMNVHEINGYNLFAGKALCGSCHFLPLFNGTVPPFYNDSEYEVIGVPSAATNRFLDEDKGRYGVTSLPEHLHAFKTPTVRNSALTAPYMHNGIYTTLEEVVEFYHKGGGAGLKLSVPNQTLPFDSLQLSAVEKADIVLFLKTLTDTVGLSGFHYSPDVFLKKEARSDAQ